MVVTFITFSQEKYPQNYFRNPLDIPIVLAGSFGELRSNHFHAGIDIKTQGREGLPVYAVADGYVSRIKVQQFGYGKAIYITHPNGYTSVYGHLQKFADEIEAYVKSVQYKKEKYATGNLYFDELKFPVKKGDVIALSGDTGSSGGPHVHFEIRETKTENIINPLLFGYEVEDSKAPRVLGVKAYALNNDSRINNQKKSFIIPLKKLKDNNYVADRISASGEIGFAVNVYDQFDKAYNKNGIYSLEMKVNGKTVYHHKVERFSFSESKFLNLHIDYEHFKKYRKRYQKTYREPANVLSTYNALNNDGKIAVIEGMNYNITLITKDLKGNTTTVKIPVVGKKSSSIYEKSKDSTNYKIEAKKFNKFTNDFVTIAFPKNTFYEDVYLDFDVKDSIAQIHTPTIPLDKNFTLTFNVKKFTEEERKQIYIANLEYPKYPRYYNTRKRDSTFFTTTKTLGNYTLLKDNKKPSIRLLHFKDEQWITNFKTLQVKIEDKESGIKNYSAFIDNEWILMEYNHKKKILTYNFNDKKLVGSKHIFKLVVSDNVGNTNTIETTFYRKS